MARRPRRGAVIVLLGVMMVALMSISAISIDFSRMWSLRNELQTSADAAAHAGALQLLPPNNAGLTIPVATSYATANPAMQGTVTVDSVVLGDWDDDAKTFTPDAPHTDAVSVVVSRQTTGLMMALMGVAQPRIRARAIGWADAPVAHAVGCIKPWAIPYVTLMYRINLYRNAAGTGNFSPPNSFANMTRTFDQVNDIAALNNMTEAERTFTLKQGSGTVDDQANSTMPGNYQAVILPEWIDGPTGDTTANMPNGASSYRDNVAGGTCNTLDIGDVLKTETGDMTGPTIQGVVGGNPANGPGVCLGGLRGETDNTNINHATFGDCLDTDGQKGVDVKAAFYYCSTGCAGRSNVEVKLLGSFSLQKVYPKKKNGVFEKSEIVGIFKPITDPGTVGTGSTTLVKPIIVR